MTALLQQELLSLASKSETKIDIEELSEMVKEVIEMIDDLTPFLQLALQSSGAHINQQSSISSSLLMQASCALNTASRHLMSKSISNKSNGKGSKAVNVCSFEVILYSLFHGSARAKGLSDWTWKQEFSRASLQLKTSSLYNYSVQIDQNFDDSNYHDENEKVGQKTWSLTSIQSMFLGTSGALLKIESNDPALVVKVVESDKLVLASLALGLSEVSANKATGTPSKNTPSKNPLGKWFAVQLFKKDSQINEELESESECEYGVSDAKDDSESELKVEKKENLKESAESLDKVGSSSSSAEEIYPLNDSSEQNTTLCSLEYLIRLASLETLKQTSHTLVKDEFLNVFMSSNNPSSTPPPYNTTPYRQQLIKPQMKQNDSPLMNRSIRTPFIDRVRLIDS